jgi:hypothetical protein
MLTSSSLLPPALAYLPLTLSPRPLQPLLSTTAAIIGNHLSLQVEALRRQSLTWEEAVRAALAPPCAPGPLELQREADTLADVLASGLVPEDRIAAAVGAVLEPRHSRESSELITEQYSDRAAALSEALKQLLEDKAEARRAALVQLKGSNSKEWQCAAALAKVETDFAARRQVSANTCCCT